jgi:hypothetical protein
MVYDVATSATHTAGPSYGTAHGQSIGKLPHYVAIPVQLWKAQAMQASTWGRSGSSTARSTGKLKRLCPPDGHGDAGPWMYGRSRHAQHSPSISLSGVYAPP